MMIIKRREKVDDVTKKAFAIYNKNLHWHPIFHNFK